jgi:hypothetical protein
VTDQASLRSSIFLQLLDKYSMGTIFINKINKDQETCSSQKRPRCGCPGAVWLLALVATMQCSHVKIMLHAQVLFDYANDGSIDVLNV